MEAHSTIKENFSEINKLVDLLKDTCKGDYYNACFPRIIVPPAGYASPKYYSSLCLVHILGSYVYMNVDDNFSQLTKLTQWHWLKYGAPTYFLAADWLRAVLATEPPEDYVLNEMQWPMPAQLFCLPIDVMYEYTGHFVPFLAMAQIGKGDFQLEDFIKLKGSHIIHNDVERVVFHYPRLFKGNAVDYLGTFYPSQKISEVITCDAFTDYYKDVLHLEKEIEAMYQTKNPTPAEDCAYSNRMCSASLKILMALNAVPEYIEHGSCDRPERTKKGILQKSIWQPNIVGAKYKPAHEIASVGERCSPRMHWRRGHFHRYHYGPKNSLIKIKWVLPILVNKEKD